jgi:hypothetical protein
VADKLARMLVSEGAVSSGDMKRALDRQAEAGGALDTAVLELRLVDEARLVGFLARASGLPAAPASAFTDADPRSRRVFPARVAERHGLAPFALEGRELSLAVTHPVDLGLLDEISFMLSLHLRPHVAVEWRVRELVQRLYGTLMPRRLAMLGERSAATPPPEAPEPEPPSTPVETAPEPTAEEPPPAGEPPARGFAGPGSEPAEPLAEALAVVASEAQELFREPPPSPAAPPLDRSAPPRWSLDEARAALAAATGRDDVVATALRYARDFFEFAAVFAVTRDAVWGHDALGLEEDARQRCRGVAVAVEAPGFFRPVVETSGPYLGPPVRDPVTEGVLAGLGRGAPRTVLLYPVILRDRLVCILYADNGEAPVSPRRVADLFPLLGSLGAAFERVLLERKSRAAVPAGGGQEPVAQKAARREAWQATEPGRTEALLPESVDVDLGDYEVGEPARASPPAPWSVEDAVEELSRSARGSPERGGLIARLAQRGGEAARALAARLPGPIEVRSEALAEFTPVHEQGPILAALAALGPAATSHLLPVLSDPAPERRRYAALALGHLGDHEAFQPLAELAFDPDPRVAAAARSALAAQRRNPEIRPAVRGLRRALASDDPHRSAQAARALARLGDVEAIPLLVPLLEAGSPEAAGAAEEALGRLTLQRLGRAPEAWLAWWEANRRTPRERWLLAALTDSDRAVRVAAAEELRAAGTPPVPYFADAPPAEREKAARAWAAWWESAGLML